MHGFDITGSGILVVALATILVAILVWQPLRDKRTVMVWLASSVVGALLGSVVTYAVVRPAGESLSQAAESPPPEGCAASPKADCPMRAKMMAMADSLGVSGKGGPKRELATLVQKLDLLTGDIAITLSAEQAAAINDCLKDIENAAKLSDDQAKAKRSQLLAVLTENQLDRLDAIAIPLSASSGGPGKTGPLMPGVPGPGSGDAAKQDEKQNPFLEDAEGEAIKSLRERLASKKTASKVETPKLKNSTPKAPPAKAETP